MEGLVECGKSEILIIFRLPGPDRIVTLAGEQTILLFCTGRFTHGEYPYASITGQYG